MSFFRTRNTLCQLSWAGPALKITEPSWAELDLLWKIAELSGPAQLAPLSKFATLNQASPARDLRWSLDQGCKSPQPPHLAITSRFSGLPSEPPHLTSKNRGGFQTNLPYLRKNRGGFRTTSPHLEKIEVVLKQPHPWGEVVEVIYNPDLDNQVHSSSAHFLASKLLSDKRYILSANILKKISQFRAFGRWGFLGICSLSI